MKSGTADSALVHLFTWHRIDCYCRNLLCQSPIADQHFILDGEQGIDHARSPGWCQLLFSLCGSMSRYIVCRAGLHHIISNN